MKSVLKSFMLGVTLSISALLPSVANAQSLPDPAIVVSISSIDEQLADVKYLLNASGYPDFNFIASATIKGYTDGIDLSRNAGMLFYFQPESETPDFMAFVPLKDKELLLDLISRFAEVEDQDDFNIIITPDGTELIVKEKDGYAFISNKESMLEVLPASPEKELGDLPTKYNLAAKIMPQRVPENLRQQMLDVIKQGSEQTLEEMDEQLQDLQKENLKMQMQQMQMVLDESEQLTIGMSADADKGSLFMDVVFKAIAGSDMAGKMAASKPDVASRFSGFLIDGALMTLHANYRVSQEDSDNYASMLDEGRKSLLEEMNQDGDFTDEEFEKLEQVVNEMAEVLKQTIKEGVWDGGMVAFAEGEDLNFAGGFQVADAKRVEKSIKDLVPMIEERASSDEKIDLVINLNSDSYKGVTFHEFIVAVPEDEEEMRKAIGDTVKFVLGVGTKELYFGSGTNPMPLVKKGMDGSKEVNSLSQFNLYATPIMKTVARLGGPPETLLMADKLEEVGKDRISAVSRNVENGFEMRFEMQDGILSLIRVGVESFQGGGFPQDDF